jgi:hypothetical protein
MHGFISMLNPILSRTLTRFKYAFQRALDRRANQNIAIDLKDIPITRLI